MFLIYTRSVYVSVHLCVYVCVYVCSQMHHINVIAWFLVPLGRRIINKYGYGITNKQLYINQYLQLKDSRTHGTLIVTKTA